MWRQKPTSLTVITAASADIKAALSAIHESLYPALFEQIEQWLAALSVRTARRRESGNEAELALTVYTSYLAEYPGDAVREVLHQYRGQWFPTWAELVDALDEYVEPRRMIRDRLADLIDGGSRYVEKALPHDPNAEKLALLRSQLESADRVAAKYPDMAEVTERKRAAIIEEINKLEA